MLQIWKHQLPTGGISYAKYPEPFEVIHVGMQNGYPHVWFLVDTNRDTIARTFEVYGTGLIIDEFAEYVGTAQDDYNVYVWHIFELGES